jgi:hypothetical protein
MMNAHCGRFIVRALEVVLGTVGQLGRHFGLALSSKLMDGDFANQRKSDAQ